VGAAAAGLFYSRLAAEPEPLERELPSEAIPQPKEKAVSAATGGR